MRELANLPVSHTKTGAPVTAGNPLAAQPAQSTACHHGPADRLLPHTDAVHPPAGMIVTYLLLVEVVKRWLMRRLR
jgi:hypothetical protein